MSPDGKLLTPPQVPERNFQKILLVRLSSLGDVIQTLPLPAVIRRAFPQARIGWAIDTELAPAIRGHPSVDYIHCCDRNRWGQVLKNPLSWPRIAGEARAFVEEIRAVGYDCALDVQGLLKSALIPFFVRIRPRIGFAHRRELTQFFYTERYLTKDEYFDPNRMHIDHMLALARVIGCDTEQYEIRLPPVEAEYRSQVDLVLSGAFEHAKPLVAITPGTQWASKRWPLGHWLALLRMVLAKTDANLVLVGSDADATIAADLMEELGSAARGRVLNLAGMTSLRELYVLFERVAVTVAADTAPLHIAGAAGCDLVGLFGATPASRTGPLSRARVAIMTATPQLSCQPCQQRVCRYGTTECMQRLTPGEVFVALRGALQHHE
jgi:lipopolysaccharide heptosyltransferase I